MVEQKPICTVQTRQTEIGKKNVPLFNAFKVYKVQTVAQLSAMELCNYTNIDKMCLVLIISVHVNTLATEQRKRHISINTK